MTQDELAAIEERHGPRGDGIQWAPTADVRRLVAEVRRLREANTSAYQRGFDAGAEQLSRALKESAK